MKIIKILFLIGIFSCLLQTVNAQQTKQKTKTKKTEQEPPKPPDLPPPQEKIIMEEAPDSTRKSRLHSIPEKDLLQFDTTALPDDELTKELRKMLTLTGSLNLGVQFAKSLSAVQNADDNILPKEFYERFFDEITNGDSKVVFEKLIITIYRKHLTLADVKQLNDFYETPVGKKYLQLLPTLLEESQNAGKNFGAAVGMRVYNQLVKEGIIK